MFGSQQFCPGTKDGFAFRSCLLQSAKAIQRYGEVGRVINVSGCPTPQQFCPDVEDGFVFRTCLLQLSKVLQDASQVVAGGQRVWVFGAQCFGAELVGPLENGVGEVVAALRPQGTSDAVGDVGLSVVQGCVDGGVGDVVVGAAGALGVVDDVVGHRDVLTGFGEQSGGGTRNRGGSPFPGLTQCFGGVAGLR